MSDTTALIKEKLDIVEALRGYISLSPAGKNFKARCPFHEEKTPSFIVSPDRGLWRCFGCNVGGDIISFVMRYENIEFFDALKLLAEKAGVDLKTTASADQKKYTVLYDINEAAKTFFTAQLLASHAAGKRALQYLAERGLTDETIAAFELGFAPQASDAIAREMHAKKFRIDDVARAGLVFKTERGTYWDRFRGRIMFPLYNTLGKVIGFTGRILDAAPDAEGMAAAKYVNSPETPIFSKSKLLFGFHQGKGDIRKSRTAVVVEGQMDLIMLFQDGVRNAVATSGTAFTNEQFTQLRRLADTLIVAFDSDEAGQHATERTIELAGAHDFDVKVVYGTGDGSGLSGKDPADIVQQSPGRMRELIDAAIPAMQYYFYRHLGNVAGKARQGDIFTLKRELRTVLLKVKEIRSPVEQAHWLGELSRFTGIPEDRLVAEMQLVTVKSVSQKSGVAGEEAPVAPEPFSRSEKLAQRILSLALASERCRTRIAEHRAFLPAAYQKLADHFFTEGEAPQLSGDLQPLADLVSLASSIELQDEPAMEKEYADVGRHLTRAYFRTVQASLQEEIRRAESAGDEAAHRRALLEFHRVSQELSKFDSIPK
jgi:DNA primase